MPVAYALGLSAIVTALWIDIPLEAVMLKTSDGMDNFPLLAIPFFILAGALMAEGGTAGGWSSSRKMFVGFIRGGLALVNILASTMFGCISGSSVADTASIGSVMIPQMIKQGYPRVFATNVTICGSLQAILLPPSHNAVIYSLAAGGTISIAHLFLAGIIPGRAARPRRSWPVPDHRAPRRDFPRARSCRCRQALRIAIDSFWGLLTVVHHPRRHPLGRLHADRSRRGGLRLRLLRHHVRLPRMQMARPAEAGRARRAHRRHGHDHDRLLGRLRLHDGDACGCRPRPRSSSSTISEDKYIFLMLINILLLVLGTFMDLAPMLLICTPILLPVIKKFGIDPVHFGMVMLLNLGIGLVTPPVGPTMVVGCAIGRVSMEAVSRSILIFYMPMLIVLMLVTYIPALTLWLPSLVVK